MPDPNFLVIGAQKSGTTWLSEMLKQHPDILTAREKEVDFFLNNKNYRKGLEWYRKQFSAHDGEKAIGEFTPHYFWSNIDPEELNNELEVPEAHIAVHEHYPEIKLIVSLRDPVRRAISAYYHHIGAGRISPRSSILDVGDRHGIISMGHYHRHLKEWMRLFPRDQFLILIFEEQVIQNKEQTLKEIFRFLEVDDTFVPEGMQWRYNERDGHLYLYLNYYFPRLARKLKYHAAPLTRLDFPKIKVTDEEIQKLKEIYRESNRKLEELLGRELSWMA